MTTDVERADCVIVGAGISGLSAAVFLARAGKSTVVFDGGRKRIESVSTVREFAGFDGMSPEEILARVQDEVTRYGGQIRIERVETITPVPGDLFDVASNQSTIHSRSVVLATGIVDQLPDVAGVGEKWGDDLRVCPCFDGYELRRGRFVVFGEPHRLASHAAWVSVWSPDVTIVSDHRFDDAETAKLKLLNIRCIPGSVRKLVKEDGKLTGIVLDNGQEVGCDALWPVFPPEKAASPLPSQLCDVDENGIAKVDDGGRTSREGVFAIGNASFPWGHMANASASGTNVGPIVANYLLEKDLAALADSRE